MKPLCLRYLKISPLITPMAIKQLTPAELNQRLLQGEKPLLLDVREDNEFAYCRIEGSMLIPLRQLPSRFTELDPDSDIVVICHHGMRSQQAALFLVQQGYTKIANLAGGIDGWSRECDSTVPRY